MAANAKKANAKKKEAPGRTRAQRNKKKKPAESKKVTKFRPLMEALRAEHAHLANILGLFKEQLDAIEQGEVVDTHVVYEIMDYMVRWPDRFHHPREDLIYSRVAEIDAKAADNVDSLQHEHDDMAKRARAVLKDIEQWRAGDVDGTAVIKSGRAYIDKLYAHMNTEEKVVFPQIESLLSATDWRELEMDDQLQPLNDPIFGGRIDREFRNMSRRLRRNLREKVERTVMVEWVEIEGLMESLEVLSMGLDNTRTATGDHLRAAVEDTREIMDEGAVKGVFRSVVNNTITMANWIGDVVDISKDTFEDLSRVNRLRKDRARLVAD
jgi:hemerythrin-like domain-containing protein